MSDINSLVGQIVPAVGAAVGAYGVSVLSRAEDQAADATVRLGQRLLDRILRRTPDRAPIETAVTDLAAAAGDPDALAALRLRLRSVLGQDPSLVAELAALLPAPPAARADGARGVAVSGNVSGIVSTGDAAINIQRR
ncbi:hypothetical protein RM550_00255 [Streptomyces sp. DSM 41527]|uniref:Uncharacterized protein n=1 Tax=Streptomyces mooreae TaxID=3075523 RepID=A0ABU2T1T0_9ACTN|nr:hypothetical protein [Streptomyces sp. DSM 41527]MDT0454169.1 hypothetical protein [Streptomyces sp. DSM 41527]